MVVQSIPYIWNSIVSLVYSFQNSITDGGLNNCMMFHIITELLRKISVAHIKVSLINKQTETIGKLNFIL